MKLNKTREFRRGNIKTKTEIEDLIYKAEKLFPKI